jgi:xanthine permease XanP
VELGLIGVRDLLAVSEQGGPGFRTHLAVAWLTLAVMVGLAVWGRGLPRLLASSAGIAVGLAASGFLGLVPDEAWRRLAAAPLATVPVPAVAGLAFPPDLVPAFLIAAVAATLRTAGVVTTCQKINDADWKRPDLASIRGGVIADGAGCALGAALGTMGMSTAPSLVGVSHGAGATSRAIAFACAAILAGLALVPKFAALFLLLPEAVIGATLVFTASFMVASGIEIIISRNLDARATIVVGVSTLVALARAVVPGYFAALSGPLLQAVTGSMLSLGVVTALLLNGLFRLGATRRLAITFESTPASLETLERTFRARATAWRLPAELVDRAAAVTREVVGHIEEAGLAHGGAEARIAGDAEELTITILYSGAPLVLPHTAVRRRPLLEERAFSYSLADLLTAVHPDRMTASVRGERVAITIAFDR